MDRTVVNATGFKWHVRIPEGYQDLKVITEVIVDDVYGLRDLHAMGFSPETIVDIGGHIGSFGVFAKSLWPRARLIAVEPDPLNYELYRLNIEENCKKFTWEGTQCIPTPASTITNAAVSYCPEKTYIVSASRTSGGGFLRTKKNADRCVSGHETRCREVKKVTTVTLEEVTKNIDKIDLLKIDCEGAEWDILENFSQPEKVGLMMGETHVRKTHLDVPYREWNDHVFWRIRIWEKIKRRFPHLSFNYDWLRRGYFQAGPKVA